jgi:hypothetical protein
MIIAISCTVLCVWVILRPQALLDSMAGWSRVLGGYERRSEVPLWVVRFAGVVLLAVCWFAFISAGAF